MADHQRARIPAYLLDDEPVVGLIPGVAIAVLLTVISHVLSPALSRLFAGGRSPFSPILCALVLGLVVGNVFRLPATVVPGVRFGIKKLLRLGIVLMGIRLSFFAVLRIGAVAVGMVALCIAASFVIASIMARQLRISNKLGWLIAAGTSICGVSAIVACAPTVNADDGETTYAIATITVFGLLATLLYPYAAELVLGLDVVQAGFFLGTSVHDTSQVTATALIYDQLWANRSATGLSGADIAITTKLVRNTFLVVVVPFLSFLSSRSDRSAQDEGRGAHGRARRGVFQYLPLFVLGYVLFGIIRTAGDAAFGASTPGWLRAWSGIKDSAAYVIAVSIACVGLNTNLHRLSAFGWKPLIVGFTAMLGVGGLSYVLVTLFASVLSF